MNCTFSGNTGKNGSCLNVQDNSSLFMNNSVFRDNAAYLGGAIFCLKNVTFRSINNTFHRNAAANVGGAIAFLNENVDRSMLFIRENTFKQNIAEKYGGALFLESTIVTIFNSTFVRNFGNGGGRALVAVRQSVIQITTSTFTKNSGNVSGYDIYILQRVNLTVRDSLFNNSIMARSNCFVRINQSNFTDEQPDLMHIFTLIGNSHATVMNSFIETKRATSTVLEAYSSTSVNFTNCIFIQTKALLFARESVNISVANSKFIYQGKHNGLARTLIDISYHCQIYISDTSITNNYGHNTFLQASINCTVSMDNLYYAWNSMLGHLDVSETDVIIKNSQFHANIIDGDSGGIFNVTLGAVYIQNSNFSNNTAKLGSLLAATYSSVIVENSTFARNTFDRDPVFELGLYTEMFQQHLRLVDCSFIENNANTLQAVGFIDIALINSRWKRFGKIQKLDQADNIQIFNTHSVRIDHTNFTNSIIHFHRYQYYSSSIAVCEESMDKVCYLGPHFPTQLLTYKSNFTLNHNSINSTADKFLKKAEHMRIITEGTIVNLQHEETEYASSK